MRIFDYRTFLNAFVIYTTIPTFVDKREGDICQKMCKFSNFFGQTISKIHVFYYNKTIAQQIHFFPQIRLDEPDPGEKMNFPYDCFIIIKNPNLRFFWGGQLRPK